MKWWFTERQVYGKGQENMQNKAAVSHQGKRAGWETGFSGLPGITELGGCKFRPSSTNRVRFNPGEKKTPAVKPVLASQNVHF